MGTIGSESVCPTLDVAAGMVTEVELSVHDMPSECGARFSTVSTKMSDFDRLLGSDLRFMTL